MNPDLKEKPKKTLPVFFVLDTSTSMTGEPINVLNRAMGETIAALKDEASKNADAAIEVAVLEFNSGANWVTPHGLESCDDDWRLSEMKAGGLTDLGDALDELDKALSRNHPGFLNSVLGNWMPVIIFMSDGIPTQDWEKSLQNIRENKWFKHGIKIAFALGNNADYGVLASVVGNVEAVIKTVDLDLFKKLLQLVTVTASKAASVTHAPGDKVTGSSIVDGIKTDENIKVSPGEVGENYFPEPEPDPDDVWDDNWTV